MSRITMSDKLALLGGDDMTLHAAPSIGLRPIRLSDGPMGLKGRDAAVAYPGGLALAATWNPALARRIGTEIGKDARASGIDVMLGPGVNLVRSPLGGRNFEYLGEDPVLAARMCVPYILGMQSTGVMATVKHLAANNSEFDRHDTNSVIDERTLHELYLPAFEASVKQADVAAVMTSYNLINGSHASENDYLIRNVLKSDWKFKGFVMSDWASTYNTAAAANAGLDVEMPTGAHFNEAEISKAFREGTLTKPVLDEKVRRILRRVVEYNVFDRQGAQVSIPRLRSGALGVAHQGALESIILLKNDRALLPLRSAVRRVAVIGPNAWPPVMSGGGSSHVSGTSNTSTWETLVRSGSGLQTFYDRGLPTAEEIFTQTRFSGLAREEFSELDTSRRGHVVSMNSLSTLVGQRAAVAVGARHLVRWSGKILLSHAGSQLIVLGKDPHDVCRVRINNQEVLTALVTEIVSPPFWRFMLADGASAQLDLECETDLIVPAVGFGMIPEISLVRVLALELARHADAVLLQVGFDNTTEFEGMDRTFALPFGQSSLIRAIARENKNTIVAVNGGGNVQMSEWVDQVPVLLQTWYPGQEGGAALAEVLLGKASPSGRLPVTFEQQLEDNPTSGSYYPLPGTHDVAYREGVFMGYRGYARKHKKPRFPFGFGLSYTSFAITHARLLRPAVRQGQTAALNVTVRNTGRRDGAQVVQLYIGCGTSEVERPERELKGFEKVFLRPNEARNVHFKISPRDRSFYDVSRHDWREVPGTCTLTVGSSAEDAAAVVTLRVNAIAQR